ncbi:hypothetical protein LSTR_LSTR002568 [Laodelphax striatellus]|uniref:Uncharacterized protein n=1 Tax=Laodelphax striatellus TaxID=195883 RepID=A0A482XKU0_LAOST|nr:hypothetical protein LSTR_LSTR002568 [Laodelphax striatellus]
MLSMSSEDEIRTFSEEEQLRRTLSEEFLALKANHRAVKNYVEKVVEKFKICLFSFEDSVECDKVRVLLEGHGLEYYEVFISIKSELESLFLDVLAPKTISIPKTNVFVNSYHITDYNKLVKFIRVGRIYDLLEGDSTEYDFDLIVVGGGPGGIAAAMEARVTGCKVAIFDFVKRSERGCRWGVGGTCLNVGCIPRNMFCHAALMKDNVRDSFKYGWENSDKAHVVDFSWKTLVSTVHDYIISQNEQITEMFQMKGIVYHNKFVTFIDKHTVKASDDFGRCCGKIYTAQNFVVATGLTPILPDFPGSKYVITIRDLFHIKENPRKVLIIGSALICLECAGFMAVLNINVTVCSEKDLLENFDRNCVNRVMQHLRCLGVKFYTGYKVESVVKLEEEDIIEYEYLVKMRNLESECNNQPYFFIEEFAVVFAAVGRVSTAKQLNVEQLEVQLTNDKTRKIIVDEMNRTNCRTIYAVGDVAAGISCRSSYTLTRKTASLVVRNLMLGTQFTVDRRSIPIVLHTPIMYGCVGLSEEAAVQQLGIDHIDVYESEVVPIEWKISRKMIGTPCYAKVICKTFENDKVIGLHYIGPNASEVLPSFALAVKMGCTKKDLDSMLGVTTSNARLFTKLKLRL